MPRRTNRGRDRTAEPDASLGGADRSPGELVAEGPHVALDRLLQEKIDALTPLLKIIDEGKRKLTLEEAKEWDRIEAESEECTEEIWKREAEAGIRPAGDITEGCSWPGGPYGHNTDRLEAALRKDPRNLIHRRVLYDSIYWRGCRELDWLGLRQLVPRKLAEQTIDALRDFLRSEGRRRHHAKILDMLNRERDRYSRAARILGRLPGAKNLEDLSLRLSEDIHFHEGNPPPGPKDRVLDGALLRLVSVMAHATFLKESHIVIELVPGVVEIAKDLFPDRFPKHGLKDPLLRWNRLKRKYVFPSVDRRPDGTYGILKDPVLMVRRYIFMNDRRFPRSLFEPHRPIRYRPPLKDRERRSGE